MKAIIVSLGRIPQLVVLGNDDVVALNIIDEEKALIGADWTMDDIRAALESHGLAVFTPLELEV